MHAPVSYAGMSWVQLAHKNADLLLLISIASLGLLPLVTIYIIETEASFDDPVAASSSGCGTGMISSRLWALFGPAGDDDATNTLGGTEAGEDNNHAVHNYESLLQLLAWFPWSAPQSASLLTQLPSSTPATAAAPQVIQNCLRGLLYMAILFPYILALLSTYVSIQLISGQSYNQTYGPGGNPNNHRCCFKEGLMEHLDKFTKELEEDDVVEDDTACDEGPSSCGSPATQSSSSTSSTTSTETSPTTTKNMWRIPQPGTPNRPRDGSSNLKEEEQEDTANEEQDPPQPPPLRTIQEDCAICMHPYQIGDKIVWAANPKCIHVYHASCLESWVGPSSMAWSNDLARRCPCCRQGFFCP